MSSDIIKNKIRAFIEDSRVEKFIITLIILNLLVYVLDTVQSFHSFYNNWIHRFEVISIAIFTIEYACRIVALDKIRNILKPMMLIDLLAILPFYLHFCPIKTTFLRIFRLTILLRILRIGKYSTAFNNIIKALKEKKEAFIVTLTLFFIAVLIGSILVYIAENPAQPQVFSSIPMSFYFCTITFTTIGYGDVVPITALGRCLTTVLSVLGIGFHGLYIGLFSVAIKNAFSKEKKL